MPLGLIDEMECAGFISEGRAGLLRVVEETRIEFSLIDNLETEFESVEVVAG